MTHDFSINKRKDLLKKLLHSVQEHQKEIVDALYNDFKKSEFESIITEIFFVESELKLAIKKVSRWAKPKRVLPSLLNFPSTDFIFNEPYGNVLIIAPWNYPFQLALCPLISAISAGNKVTLKPSELAPNTSSIIKKVIDETFQNNYVTVVEGGAEATQKLLAQRWDYIFFTGSVAVGKIVAQAAAPYLTPVTLELGGKNPCIVDRSANIKLAAKRIVWGKLINAGQTCIAPDYVLAHTDIKKELIAYIKQEIILAYGKNVALSPDFPRIINLKNWERLHQFLNNQNIIFGGDSDKETLYIGPTLLDEPKMESQIMQEEIFGPILPILSYNDENQIEKYIHSFEKPLALYVFSSNKTFAQKMIATYLFGGGWLLMILLYIFQTKNCLLAV
jgi:aldehyde dehydrogenase (NAD+)